MEGFWKQALKVTGPVAVVGFILWFVLKEFFSQNLLALFNNEQQFTMSLIVICGLMVILFTSIFTYRKPASQEAKSTKYKISNNKIQGDFVVGDKNVSKGADDE